MPFSREEFFAIFAAWNTAAWPYWLLAYPAGLIMLVLCLRGTGRAPRVVLALLGVMWIVCGAGYQWAYFAQINPAARGFALGFVLEGALLIAFAITTDVRISARCDLRTALALVIMVYGLVLYPLVGWAFGHSYPEMPIFGIAPCPTVIFTLGALMLMSGRGVGCLLVVPFLWGGVGGSAALLLGVPQDYGLIAATVIAAALMLSRSFGRRSADHA
ncbi:DUF6064 family protein [Salipiger sp. PrR002]|uniref:DUF6064 family protein n=1 Tax=unclassified Salipiger TaxID=2640570 RepID=UPI0013B749B0|nr:DUF6064 family protein [Salipiger sp. PrR002]NDW02630.1 hypothetical protein [Salipiger sp. PrR002]NDW59877.1 hypothetical protein [Salipiger sp. PrR004]